MGVLLDVTDVLIPREQKWDEVLRLTGAVVHGADVAAGLLGCFSRGADASWI